MMKFHPGKFALAIFLNLAMFMHSAQAELSQITFDTVEWVPLASVGTNPQSGWQSYSGNAVVSPNGEGYTGGKALLIPAGTQQEGMISRQITWNATDQTAFIDMMLKPAADPEGSLATIYANGTQLAFQLPAGSETGSIWVYHGNDGVANPTAQPEQWAQTVGSFHVPTGNTQADAYVRVTLRHDYQRNLWDLFVDGKLAAANLSFEGRGSNLTDIDFYGSLVGDTRVDNLSALVTNMLFPDADKDGLPDAWEIANGSNPNVYDRDAVKAGTGTSFLDLYMASLWGTGGVNGNQGIVSTGTIPPITILGNHQPVGALKGSLSVGLEGTASYTIPIDVPKGTAGMEPKISLAYSSGGGSGMAGLGWSLTGFQRITRGPSAPLKDGSYDPANFDSSDRFFLDGERLICVSGAYGAAGSEYRTEFDSFARITAVGSAPVGSGPDSWKVETKAGLIVTLGGTADSKSQVSQGTQSWGVNKVSDTVGNYYSVDYARDSAIGLPFNFINDRVAAVHYTGNAAQGLAPYCHIVFDYEDRPDVSRAYSTYAGVKVSKRLSKITVKTDSFINHSYRLAYTTSYQTGRSLLTSITKMMQDEPSLSVPATTFNYDGLQSGQAIWKDPGGTGIQTYSTNVDATEYVNSMITTEDNNTALRLTGDVARAYPLPSPVTINSDTKIQFEYKGSSSGISSIIGLDADRIYQSPNNNYPATQTKLYRIGGTGDVRLAPNEDGKDPYFRGTALTYNGGWQTYTLDATKFGSGVMNFLIMMVSDETMVDGVNEAWFRNVKIYRSGTQNPADVTPIIFNTQGALPRFLDGDGNDLGVVFMDLNADGLPDFTDWRVNDYALSGSIVIANTYGNAYSNTGNGFVVNNALLPSTQMPLAARKSAEQAYKTSDKHHLLGQPMDINSDGRLDLMVPTNLMKSGGVLRNGYTFYTQTSTGWAEIGGYELPFRIENTSSDESNGGKRRDYHFQWMDLNGDGYQDLAICTTAEGRLYDKYTNAQIAGGTTSVVFMNKGKNGPGWVKDDSFRLPEALMWIDSGDPKDIGRRVLDLDGDGLPEIAEAWYDGSAETRHTYKMVPTGSYHWNSTVGQQNPPASSYDLPIGLCNASGVDKKGAQLFDCNGDGLVDILQFSRDNNGPSKKTWLNEGYRASSPWVLESAPATTSEEKSSYVLPVPLTQESDGDTRVPYGHEKMDINGDGLVDILYSNEDTSYTPGPDNLALINTGNGWLQRSEWGLPGANRITISDSDRKNGRRRARLQDINGDGFPDAVLGILDGRPQVWYNQCKAEVMTTVTDGFGSQLQVEYKRMNDPSPTSSGFGTRVYDRQWTNMGPLGITNVTDNRLLVSRYSEPDGLTANGRRWKSQRYSELLYDNVNQVSLGFGKIEAMDELTGQITETTTARTYPFNGSPVSTKTFVTVTSTDLAVIGSRCPGVTVGKKLLSEETATYAEMTPQVGVGGSIRRVVQTGSVQKHFDLSETLLTQTTTTQNLADFDAYGFVKKSTVTSLDGTTVVTESNYNHIVNSTQWLLGRLSDSTVAKSSPGKTSITKSSGFAYNTTTGLLTSETVQPGHSLSSTKSYTYDGFGNITATNVTASGATRSGTSTYDSRGRFMTREQNVLGQHVDYVYDTAKALVTSTIDLNGKSTGFTYDAFGTKILTHHPDGTKTAEITGFASNSSLPSSVAGQTSNPIKYFRATQSSGGPVTKVYLDAMGRELVKETTILRNANTSSGRYSQVYAATRYDSWARKVDFTEPFGAGETPRFTHITYDLLNRALVTTHPDGTSDDVITYGNATLGSNIHTYSKVQNANGMILERWENEQGRLVQSKDPSGLTTIFTHDVEGRLVSVTLEGDTLLTNTFDLLGNKTSVWEANSGTSTSVYNGFGETTSSTNAKAQTTSYTYDNLGRALTVTKPDDGTYTTVYDGAPGAGMGKPWKITGPDGYSEEIAYDTMGRPIGSTKTQYGETFTTATSYNLLGLPLTERDAGGLIVVHEYDSTYSFPLSLKIGPGVEGAGTVLWKAGTYDSKGRPLTQTLAQGISASAEYNSVSGMLERLLATHATSGTLQDKSCAWSSIGNLTSRTDNLTHLQETFSYDGLNRVTGATTVALAGASISTVPPPQTYSYDTKGNLLTKAGATMSYGGTRPHAVTSATVKGESRTYAYDAAGYVTSDTKRTYTWTSFGQLRMLDYAAAPALDDLNGNPVYGAARVQSTFWFDAGGNRSKQLKERIGSTDERKLEETLYLGSYEREIHTTKASSTATPVLVKTVHRHSLGGIGVYTKTVNATTGTSIKLTTVLKDHLGSTSVLFLGTWDGTNFSSPVIEGQSFDPWGERRNANTWTNFHNTSSDSYRTSGQEYDRGYTGHEQLDDSGLIHMNGRVYDPEIGRFLSPDPLVQVPEYSQNFNRYSYVMNNPLNATDPSGFSWISKAFHKLGSWIKENWRVIVVIIIAIIAWYAAPYILGAFGAGASITATGTAATAAGLAAQGAVAGAITGASNAALYGGDAGDILRGAVVGAVQGAISGGVLHGMAPETAGFSTDMALHVAGHGIVGGAANAAMGGKFQDGFISAAVTAGAGDMGMVSGGVVSRTIKAGIIGGTVSAIGGGKFANGAVTSALQYLCNEAADNLANSEDELIASGSDGFTDSGGGEFPVYGSRSYPGVVAVDPLGGVSAGNYEMDIHGGQTTFLGPMVVGSHAGLQDASLDLFSLVPIGRASSTAFKWAVEAPPARFGLVQVTSWAEKGISPVIDSGRWVMTGGASKWNYMMSGVNGIRFSLSRGLYKLEVPFSNATTQYISASRLVAPGLKRGVDAIKGLWPWGQRIIK